MRRAAPLVRRLLAVMLVGALATLSACATESGDDPESSNSGASGGAFPVTIDTKFGGVTIDQPPQRVVALGWSDAEVALSLGVQPIGASDWLAVGGDGLGPWVEQRYRTPPTQLGTLDIDREKLAGLNPDLILDTRASGDKERYDQLSELGVPVVGPPKGADAYLTSWQDQLEMIGKALGKQDKATQLRTGLEDKFAEAKRRHPEFDGATVAVGARTAEEYGAYVDGDGRVEFLKMLGFENSEKIQDLAKGDFYVSLSAERLDLLDADLTVTFPINVDAKKISDDPLYKAIPSVRDGHGVLLSDQSISQAFSSASVLGMSYALDKTVPMFAKAVKSERS